MTTTAPKPTKRSLPAVLQMPPAYLRQKEAANYLRVSVRTLRNWTKARAIPFARPPNSRVVLYARTDLDKAIERVKENAFA